MKKHQTQFTCVTCSLPVKTGKFTYSYAASTSRGIDVIARYKARKLRVTSPAGCRLTYLHFAGEFNLAVTAYCLQLQVFLGAIAGIFACDCACIFACDCACIFACVCSYSCLHVASIFTCDSCVFSGKLHSFLPANAGVFAC